MRIPNEALKDRRRREILRAATRCFVRHGFHQSTMDQICVTAGLSPGAVYRYFRSKHAIIESIAGTELAAVVQLIEPLRDADDFIEDFIEIAEQLVLSPVNMHEARLGIEIMAEASRNRRMYRAFELHGAKVKGLLQQAAERARALGQIDPSLAPAPLAELLLALIEGVVGRALFNPHYDRRSLARSFRVLATRFLQPRESRKPRMRTVRRRVAAARAS